MKTLEWLWKDSTTGKSSSTKIIQVLIVLGIVALCVVWAIQGDLTFDKGKDFVMWIFGIQTAGNVGTRGVKAYTNTHQEPQKAIEG
jgi:hypothetical protein